MRLILTASNGSLPSSFESAVAIPPVGVTPSGELKVRNFNPLDVSSLPDVTIANAWEADVLDTTLTLDNAAYADGDVLAEVQEIPLGGFTSGYINSLQVIDPDDQGQALDVYYFNCEAPAGAFLGAENAAVAISDANSLTLLGRIDVGANDYYDLGGVRHAIPDFKTFVITPNNAGSIYVGAVIRGTAIYAGQALTLRTGIIGIK